MQYIFVLPLDSKFVNGTVVYITGCLPTNDQGTICLNMLYPHKWLHYCVDYKQLAISFLTPPVVLHAS